MNLRGRIARDNPEAAKRVAAIINAFVERQLSDYPNCGRIGRVAGTPELVIPRLPYIVPYRIEGDRIEFLSVDHGTRMWPVQF
jgi:plasmid stabilization system protein ParE